MKQWWWLVVVSGLCALRQVSAVEIEVVVRNPPATGDVIALVFDSPEGFDGLRGPVARVVLADQGRLGQDIALQGTGLHVVVVYHDANTNGVMDRNFIGIPREPIGFSRGYWPKGPPNFARAAVEIGESGDEPVDIELKSIFGERGLIGFGVGVVASRRPYRDADSSTDWQLIPAISYLGDRIQVFGLQLQVGLLVWENVSLGVASRYRFGAYEEDDAGILKGMEDRDDTVYVGPSIRVRLDNRVDVNVQVESDVLDTTGGTLASIELGRSFYPFGFNIAPSIGMEWMSGSVVRYEYGVEATEVLADRPFYQPDDSLNLVLGLTSTLDVYHDWSLLFRGTVEILSDEITESPLIDDSMSTSVFLAVNRLF